MKDHAPPSHSAANAAATTQSGHISAWPTLAVASSVIAVLAVAAYMPSLDWGFVRLDDYQYVVDNEVVRFPSVPGAVRFFTEVRKPSTVEGYYQPLTMLSLMLDAVFSGAPVADISPFAFHLSSILLHAATCILVFIALHMIVGGTRIPLLIALIFAFHPVQVESVSWISQRKTVLASALALASIICYLRAASEERRTGLRGMFACSFFFYVLANLAKPTVVLLPLVFPLLDHWPLRRPVIASLREKWPFLPAMLLFGWIAVVSQASAGEGGGLALARVDSLEKLARWIGLLSYNIALYVGNVLWPASLSPYRAIPDDLSLHNASIVLAVLLVLGLLGVWLAARRWAPSLFVGLSAAGVLLLPTLGVGRFMASCVADRFLYLPLFFVVLPVAAAAAKLRTRRPRHAGLVHGALVGLLLPLLVLMRAQQTVWRDSGSLWRHVADMVPNLDQAQSMLAAVSLEEGDYDAALRHAERAFELDNQNAHHFHLLGRSYVRTGRVAEALPLIEEALSRDLGENTAAGQEALAEALACAKRHDEAEAACQAAIRSGYKPAACYSEVGDVTLLIAGDYEAAAAYYRRALVHDADHVLARWNLGTALEYLGRGLEALEQYEVVRRIHEAKGVDLPPALSDAIARLRRRISDARMPDRPAQDTMKPTNRQ